MLFRKKNLNEIVLHERFVRHISISGDSIVDTSRFYQNPSQLNKLVLKQVEENAKTEK